MISFVWTVISSLIKLIIILRNYAFYLEKNSTKEEEAKNQIIIKQDKVPDVSSEKVAKIHHMSADEILKDLIEKENDEEFKKVLQKLMK